MCKEKRTQEIIRKVARNRADEVWCIYEKRDKKDLTTVVLVYYNTHTAVICEIHGGYRRNGKQKKVSVKRRTVRNCFGFDPYNVECGYQELLRQARAPRCSYAVREI